ncbi:MAG: hypothetical protein GY845_31040 [Planctomycetes bacterium]|nr:hypothetical protein [Planctomycetota bacterium]
MIYEIPNTQCATSYKLYAVISSTTVENIRQNHPYLKKQTQFQKCKMMQAQYIQGIIKKIASSGHEKTNPIYRGVLSRRSFSEDGSIKRRRIQSQLKPNNQLSLIDNQLKATLKGAEFNMLFLTKRQKFDRMGSNTKWLNPRWKLTRRTK